MNNQDLSETASTPEAARTNAMFLSLQLQRDQALMQVVNLNGELASVRFRNDVLSRTVSQMVGNAATKLEVAPSTVSGDPVNPG